MFYLYRNRIVQRACTLAATIVLAACGPDCSTVCQKNRDCMGDESGSLDGCISRCTAQDFQAMDAAMQCIEDSSCTQIKAGACAPSCPEVCARAIACDVPTDALCSTTCASLSYAQQECYIVNDCSVVRETCTGLSNATTP